MLLFLLATLSWRDPERHIVLLVAGAGAVAICGALLVVLTYTVQRPMVELQQKIAQLGSGDLSVSVSFAHRNDEIGDLGRNFNQMVPQLAREPGRDRAPAPHADVTRRTSSRRSAKMATGLAHEIRNPLAGIAGVIEIIGRDLPATSPARAVVKDVRQEIARINHIVTDLLQTARPHPPKGPQERSQHHRRTRRHARPPAGTGQGRRDRAAQRSFLARSRARQRSDPPGAAESAAQRPAGNRPQGKNRRQRWSRKERNAVVEVTDNGRGIAPDNLPNIFRPFYTTKGDGTGLGLSLARRIVEDHQGRIDVTSTVGKGTTFAVVLPLQRATTQATAN